MWGELRPLSDEALARTAEAFASDGGALLELMADVGLGQPAEGPAREQAEALGFVEGAKPTMVGMKVADSCREYRFWEARGRRMPREDVVPEIGADAFEGLDVVELGSGFGCNLLTLATRANTVVGVDLEPVYGQMSSILADKAGLRAPRVVLASADRTGLDGERFDRVLVIGALQYMPIRATLREAHRLLRPGGQLLVLNGHFSGWLGTLSDRLRAGHRPPLRELVNLPSMLLYPWIGRALMKPSEHVYLPRGRMRRWLAAEGLTPVEVRGVDRETLYIAERSRR